MSETHAETLETLRYPDVQKLIPTTPTKNTKRVGMYGGVMSMVSKVYGANTQVHIELRGANEPLQITPLSESWDSVDCRLMLCTASLLDEWEESNAINTIE